jgi:hypothetical protein
MIDTLIYKAFMRHIRKHHIAEYEVCHHPLCWFAYKIELIFRKEYSDFRY